MIIGYIYSQKCNKNAKKIMLIYFEFWKYFWSLDLLEAIQEIAFDQWLEFHFSCKQQRKITVF